VSGGSPVNIGNRDNNKMNVRINPGMTDYMPLRPQTTRAMERRKKVGTAIQPRVMMSIGLAEQRGAILE